MCKLTDLDLPLRLENYIKQVQLGATTPCWIWQGEINRNGYGRLRFEGGRYMAHIFMYKRSGKPFKVGRVHKYEIDHLCENRACCNPDHLQQVTQKVNLNRKFRRRKHA